MKQTWKKTAVAFTAAAVMIAAAPAASLAKGCGSSWGSYGSNRGCDSSPRSSHAYSWYQCWDDENCWDILDCSHWRGGCKNDCGWKFFCVTPTKNNGDCGSNSQNPDIAQPEQPSVDPETPPVETPDVPTVPDEPDTPATPENPGTSQTPGSTVRQEILDVVDLVNEARAENGLKALTLDTSLCAAADVRAKEIVTSFSHTRPNGSSCFTAMDEAGISYRYAAENIAYGYRDAATVMNGWLNSSGHRQNIMSTSAGKIGVGLYTTSDGTSYWVQLFMD